MTIRDEFIQVAEAVPFDGSGASPAFTSEDANSAIIEARDTARGEASRGGFVCSFDGTASTGRWLEFSANNPSNTVPMIVAEPGQIRALSLASSASSTGTVTIYKNGVSIDTLSLSASKKASKKDLTHAITDLDEISVQATSGSISRPNFYIFIQTY